MLASSKGFFLGPSLRFLLLCFCRNIFSHFFPFSGKLLCWNCVSSVLQRVREFAHLIRLTYFRPVFILLYAIVHAIEGFMGFVPGEKWSLLLFSLCDYNIAQKNRFCKTECCTNKDICNCTKHRLRYFQETTHWQMTFVYDILIVLGRSFERPLSVFFILQSPGPHGYRWRRHGTESG